jgi:ABC-type glycerol-3-phosphate transport system substrate-binding protein
MTTGNRLISRRRFLQLGALATGGAVLAACTPAAPAPAPAEQAPAATQVPAAAAATEPPTPEPTVIASHPGSITIWSMAMVLHEKLMNAAIDAYKKENPDQKFDYQPQPGDFTTKERAALAASGAPDLFIMHGTALMEMATAKALQPLTPSVLTVDEVKRDFMPEQYLQSLYKDNIYALGVPDPPGDAGLVVNQGDLEDAGLKPLAVFESTDQMLEYGRKLTVTKGNEVQRAGLMFTGEGNIPVYWLSYIVDLGGKFFDNDKQVFTLQTPEAEKALQFFSDIVLKEHLDDLALGNNMFNALGQGLASMAFMWPEFVPLAKQSFPDLKMGFTVKPGMTPGKAAIFNHSDTWNLTMWSGSQNKDACFKFLQFCKQKDIQRLMLTQNPGMSPLKSINFDPNETFWTTGDGAYMAPALKAVTEGQLRYYGPWGNGDTLEYNIMYPVITDLLGKKYDSVKAALADMEAKLNAEMTNYRQKYPDVPPVQIYFEGLPADLLQGIPMKTG